VPPRKSALQNSLWYGFETALDVVVNVGASIAVARVMGPERLGYLLYLMFLTNVAGKVGGAGIAAAVRKYMAEHLARGEHGLARIVFVSGLSLQAGIAAIVAVAGCLLALSYGEPEHRPVAYILVAACVPGLLTLIPAQAHMASEDFRRNVPSAIAGQLAYAAGITLSLTLGWGLVGLASAHLARRTTEASIRIAHAAGWVRRLPKVPRPKYLWPSLLRFSAQSLAITVVTVVVWDRSEVVFLRQFSAITELAYYSLAFTLVERALLVSTVLGSAFSAKIMAGYTRAPHELGGMITGAMRHVALIAMPLQCGLAALSAPVMHVAYGSLWEGSIPVLAISALLGIPKMFQWLPITLLQAADRQGRILKWLLVAAAVNVGLDATLIPAHGAIGAAFANGLAQAFAIGGLWLLSVRFGGGARPFAALSRVAASAAVMTIPVAGIALVLPPLPAALAGVSVGAIVYGAMIRWTRALTSEDAAALAALASRLPGIPAPAAMRAARFLAAAGPREAETPAQQTVTEPAP
jgi:O-antigen/teichoic acid export membrane protein